MHSWYARRDLRRAGLAATPNDPAVRVSRRARFHGGVWLSYLAGGVLGAFLAIHWDLWSLMLPLVVLGVLIVIDFEGRAERGARSSATRPTANHYTPRRMR